MSPPIIIIPGWLDLRGAAAYSSICRTNIAEAVKDGVVETRFQAGKRLIKRESLDAWIEAGTGKREASVRAVERRAVNATTSRHRPELTSRQQEIMKFLRSYSTEHGYSPTTREIQQHFGFASQTASLTHLNALARKGAITRSANAARSIVIMENDKQGLQQVLKALRDLLNEVDKRCGGKIEGDSDLAVAGHNARRVLTENLFELPA